MDATPVADAVPQEEPGLEPQPDAPEPIPPPHALGDQGRPVPLPGVEPVFLTGTTVELLGLQPPIPADGAPAPPLALVTVPKDKVLGDIQFRGAISDFHALKSKIQAAEGDALVLRYLEDDVYGEGCNYEVALVQQAAETWRHIIDETERRRQQQEAAAAEAAAVKRAPRVRQLREPAPWRDQGSEAELREHALTPSRPEAKVLVVGKRRTLGRAAQLADKDALELWSSAANECRPFKDPAYDLRRVVRDSAVQAASSSRDAAVQTSGGRLRPGAVQYEPRDMSDEQRRQHLASPHFQAFLRSIEPRCELALLQNEVVDVLADDLAALGEDDEGAGQLAAGSATAAAGSGAALGRKERGLSEVQAFADLAYSKSKVVSALQWVPHRRGVVAVALTDPTPFAERAAQAGSPRSHHVLFWSFRDPIHPELVLESPSEVFCFAFNPANPDVVAAGCYNGQVVLWDLAGEWDRAAAAAGGRGGDADGSEEAAVPMVHHKWASAVEHSHNTQVADLQWLPGLEFGAHGRLQPSGSRPNSSSTPASAAGGQQQGKGCCVLATTAADGRVLFWDSRVERLLRKGRRAEDATEVAWKPSHSMHLLSSQGMDLQAARLCFDLRDLEAGRFYIGSAEGELVAASFSKGAAGAAAAGGQQHGGEAPGGGDGAPAAALSTACCHCGPLVAVQRSPFLEDVLLTVGDWTFQVWREGDAAPLFVSPYAPECYTGGCWSPSRPGVVLLTDQAGGVEAWDLLDRSHTPVLRAAAASTALSAVSLAMVPLPGSGATALQLLAVGDSAGTLRVLELPRNLRRTVHNEKKSMAAWVARAAAGAAEVVARAPARAAALKQLEEAAAARAREEAEAAAGAAAASSAPAEGGTAGRSTSAPGPGGRPAPDGEAAQEAEYAAVEAEFMAALGLVQAAA